MYIIIYDKNMFFTTLLSYFLLNENIYIKQGNTGNFNKN